MTVRIAVIGCGAIARRAHIPAFESGSDASVVAVASNSVASAQAAAAETQNAEVVTDWRDLVDRNDVDAVDICSPNAFHHEQVVAFARAGKHVLVEKPIARTTKEADDMVATARDAGVVLHVAHNVRYVPAIVAVRQAVADRKIGPVIGVRAAFGHAGPKNWAPDSTWFFDAERSGGGALIDLGVHIIDAVHFVTGYTTTEVTAMTYGSDPVEDAAQVVMRFDSGAVGSIHASWVARPAPDMMLTLFGTEGTLHFDVRTPLTVRSATGEKEEIELPKVDASPYADFVAQIAGSSPRGPAASGEEGRAALAVVEAAYQSARSGRTIEIG